MEPLWRNSRRWSWVRMTQLSRNIFVHTLTYDHLLEFLQSGSIVEHRCYPLLPPVQGFGLAGSCEQHRPLEDDQVPEVLGPAPPETVQTLLNLDTVAHTPSEWTLHVGDDGYSLDPDPL